jgi:hypothetical protein
MQGILRLIGVGGVFLALMATWPPAAAKAEVNLRTEFTNETTSSTRTDKETGQVTSTDRDRFDQLYNLEFGRHVYPNLSFRAGGIFQFSDVRSTSEGTTTKSGSELLHPFLDLNLANPIFTTGFGYDKTISRQSGTGQVTTKDTRDQLHGRFLWTPVDFPRLNLNYTKTHRYDDLATNDLHLNLRYDWHDIFTNYSYVTSKTNDLVRGLKSWHDAHDGRISFSRDLTRDLNLSASYRANYTTEEWSGGGQPFFAPLSLGSTKGFYVLDDNAPLDWGTTPPLINAGNFLVDGVKSGSSPINLGLNGDETKNVSFGLDFGFESRLSTIRVWVDRDASEVENAFAWTIYTSPDNLNWTVQSLAQPVSYVGGIENYFEFTLSASVATPVTARYIKMVTMPLTNAVDPPGHFRDLYVTEVEPFSLDQGNITRSNLENSATMGLLWRLDPKTSMGYSVFYRNQRTEADMMTQRNNALSQTVNLNRMINQILTGSVRGSREDRHTPSQDSLDYSYGASLAAGWLDTFRQSLSYNGTWSKTERPANSTGPPKEISKTNSVVLRNVAELYRGWSANVDFGYTWSFPWDEGQRATRLFRVESTIIPNPKLTVNTGYFYSRTTSDQPPSEDQRLELSFALSPTSAISLFSRLTVIDQGGTSKVYQNYSLDWSPFPDGALQLFVTYSESLTNEGADTQTSLAGFDWRVNSGTVLRTSYSKSVSESLHDKTDSQVISVTLRLSL